MRNVHSGRSRLRRTGSSAGRRRAARCRKPLSKSALWAVKIGTVETFAELGEHVVERGRALERASG